MSRVTSPVSFLFLFCIFIACIYVTESGDNGYIAHLCDNEAGNYTKNSAYDHNLGVAVANILVAANASNSGFYTATVGQNSDKVTALVFCRGDLQPDICRGCVRDTLVNNGLRAVCPNQKAAVLWYEECMFRYSNRSILNNSDSQPAEYAWDFRKSPKPDIFDKDLQDLLNNLRQLSSTTKEKFATGNVSGPDFSTIYGLMQCTPDLSSTQCGACLDTIMERIPDCCSGVVAGEILARSSKLRFATVRFYNETHVGAPQPRLPPRRTPPPPPLSHPRKDDNSKRTVIIIVGVTSFVIVVLVMVCTYQRKLNKRTTIGKLNNEDSEVISSAESLQYDFATVEVITNYFSDSNKLGQGGFGVVYRGTLENGEEVAVKRLSRGSAQGEQEFKNEVTLVARLQHRNLVRLLGFCFERTERLLIYEFVPNASLDNFIFDSVKRSYLYWERRYKIIGGIAKGLLYLHEDSRLWIIQRDLKASNVLLDADMNPKIADFGMARLFNFDETQGNTSRIVGTYGYMAPEYAIYGHFSAKSDVFSFGILVLEITSGRKNYNFQNGDSIEDLATFVWNNWRKGTAANVIDPILRENSGSIREMIRCIHIGLLCIQEKVADRPTMASVVLMLNSSSISLALPSEPAFFMHSSIDPDTGTLHADNISLVSNVKDKSVDFSINEASITDLYPR